jgi:hypothetical protein
LTTKTNRRENRETAPVANLNEFDVKVFQE